jgi:hypothetical protein
MSAWNELLDQQRARERQLPHHRGGIGRPSRKTLALIGLGIAGVAGAIALRDAQFIQDLAYTFIEGKTPERKPERREDDPNVIYME